MQDVFIAGVGMTDFGYQIDRPLRSLVEAAVREALAELIVSEEIGLCEPGDGPKLLRSGDTALGGRGPINPSGGLLSKGHSVKQQRRPSARWRMSRRPPSGGLGVVPHRSPLLARTPQ